jgi:probable HAF family extracellular repeat protein
MDQRQHSRFAMSALVAAAEIGASPAVCLLTPGQARAGAYTFVAFSDPSALLYTFAKGIDDAGQVVGYYYDSQQRTHGFLEMNGRFTKIDDPASPGGTIPYGIDTAGQMVGTDTNAALSQTGSFLHANGIFTPIADPLATGATIVSGIGDAGQIAGYYSDATGVHGFVDTAGKFTTINAPQAPDNTVASGINASGQIAGSYSLASGIGSFVDTGGRFAPIGAPNTFLTVAQGINDAGDVVGYYEASAGPRGFLDTNGSVVPFDDPTAPPGGSFAEGIDNGNQIVGFFADGGRFVSYFATPSSTPEPASLGLLGSGLFGVLLTRRRRRLARAAVVSVPGSNGAENRHERASVSGRSKDSHTSPNTARPQRCGFR